MPFSWYDANLARTLVALASFLAVSSLSAGTIIYKTPELLPRACHSGTLSSRLSPDSIFILKRMSLFGGGSGRIRIMSGNCPATTFLSLPVLSMTRKRPENSFCTRPIIFDLSITTQAYHTVKYITVLVCCVVGYFIDGILSTEQSNFQNMFQLFRLLYRQANSLAYACT